MSKSTSSNKSSKEPSVVAQLGLFSVVAIVAGVGIWSQLKTDDNSQKVAQQTPIPTSPSSPPASAPVEPVAMAAVPAVDYTSYTEKPASAPKIQSTKQDAVKEDKPPQKSNTSEEYKADKKIDKKAEVKPQPVKEENPSKKSEPVSTKALPASSNTPAEKPKSSDFSYTQPVVSSNKPSLTASSPAPAVSSLETAKPRIVPKIEVFEPVGLESAGDKAWVKISPSSTVIVEKGQELPNYGKLKEISATQLVFEKGSIPFEKAK